ARIHRRRGGVPRGAGAILRGDRPPPGGRRGAARARARGGGGRGGAPRPDHVDGDPRAAVRGGGAGAQVRGDAARGGGRQRVDRRGRERDRAAARADRGRVLAVSGHLDTVFPERTDVTVR